MAEIIDDKGIIASWEFNANSAGYFFITVAIADIWRSQSNFLGKNLMGQTIGTTRNHHLVNLQGQVLAEVRDGTVYRGGGAAFLVFCSSIAVIQERLAFI